MSGKQQQPGATVRRPFRGAYAWPVVLILGTIALPLSALADNDAAQTANASSPGPKGRATPELSHDPIGIPVLDAQTAWQLPPGGAMRGPMLPIYDNGAPLDDFGDPASQASLQVDGASIVWRFMAAAADNLVLPDSITNPGGNHNITVVRVAVDFFQTGSESATPLNTWLGAYVTIYTNSPLNQPGGAPALVGGNVTFTGNVVASVFVPVDQLINEVAIDTGCRVVHQIDIPVDFVLASQTPYWLSVMPRFAAPPQSAWCLSDGTDGVARPAHRGATFDVPFWTVVEGNLGIGSCSAGAPAGSIKELSFQLFGEDVSSDVGACCNTVTGTCIDVDRIIDPGACMEADEVFSPGQLCELLEPACNEGACCYTNQFNQDVCIVTTAVDCAIVFGGHAFRLGQSCTPDLDCTRPPPNDDCTLAETLAGNNVVEPFNSANATTNPATPSLPGCGPMARDIWYRWNATCDGTAVITTVGSSFDTVIAVYRNGTNVCPPCPIDNTNFDSCNDNNPLDPGSTYSILAVPVTVGECLLIRVGGKPSATPDGGDGVLRIFCVPAGQGACCKADGSACTLEFEANCSSPNRWLPGEPCDSPNACLPNDACVSPLPLPNQKQIHRPFNTTRATTSPQGQPTDCGNIANDVWFSYVAPCDGDVEITTAGSTFDTFIVVYDFNGGITCPDPTFCSMLGDREIACSDDEADALARVRIANVSSGDCLIIRVGGKPSASPNSGPGLLNVFCISENEGACCFSDDSCEIVEEDECLAPSTFFPGVICEDDTPCGGAPENDLCEDAIELSGSPVSQPYNTTSATTDDNAPQTQCGDIAQDIWYTYTAPCTGTLLISTEGSAYDTALAVYGGAGCPVDCPQPSPDGDFTELACSDDAPGLGTRSRVILPVTSGECLLIRVGGKDLSPTNSGGAGVLNIECFVEDLGACCHADRTCTEAVTVGDCAAMGDQFFPLEGCNEMNCPPLPPNDECDGAILIGNGPTPIDTTTATDSAQAVPPSPTCAQPTKDLWYRYEASCTGTARVTLCGAVSFNSVIVVYDDCEACGDETSLLACDNNGCGVSGDSEVFFPVVEEACYLIRVGGVAGASGTGVLSVSCQIDTGCCPGDVDLSGVVDLADPDLLVAILLDPIEDPDDPAFCPADVNGDGELDGRDIQAFVFALLDGLPCEFEIEGACCSGTVCTIASQADCLASDGFYLGNFTTCEGNPCLQFEFGACCIGPACSLQTIAGCVQLGGDFKGDGTECQVNTCTPPPPPVTCENEFVVELEAENPAAQGLGDDVAMSGSAFVAGAPSTSSAIGSAYVFRNAGGVWSQEEELTADDGTPNARLGDSVAMDGDRIMVGASGAQVSGVARGAVYEFERVGGVWQQGQKVVSSYTTAGELFGFSVSIDGSTMIIGAPQNNEMGLVAGAAYIFEHDGVSWTETQKLFGSDIDGFDNFGASVVIRGDYAVVGAHNANTGGINHGAAYVFERIEGMWTQVAKLQAADLVLNSAFGWSVDISGNKIIVGAYQTFSGGFQSGGAYIFERSGGIWQQTQKLVPSDAASGQNFGSSVRMVGDAIAVGARGRNAVYLFVRDEGQWQESDILTSPSAVTGDLLGFSVDWDGETLVAGAQQGEVSGNNTGTVHVFGLTCDGACCIGGNCQMQGGADCANVGGVFQGTGVQCGVDVCVPDEPGACCPGDFNNSGTYDIGDIQSFVDALLDPPIVGTPEHCLADTNEDGDIDGLDIAPFVADLLAGLPCTQS